MFGVRNNCELVHAYLGGYAGIFTAILLLMGLAMPAGSMESVQLSLLTAVFAIGFITFQFVLLYRQRFTRFFPSVILPGILYGFILYHIMLLVQSIQIAVLMLLFLIGVVIGVTLGRVLCAACNSKADVLTHKA
ncbi:MAG: hypothetical protein OQK78_05840 [Gammaproteobacteria bacterium]|nr:hypothetical protein [Gammaproteobacteria bacterium]